MAMALAEGRGFLVAQPHDNVTAARFCDGGAMDFAFALLGAFADG